MEKDVSGKTENHQTNYINDDNGKSFYAPQQTAEIFAL
jgi:hypothetical protein